MSPLFVILLVFSSTSLAFETKNSTKKIRQEHGLCRNCGRDIIELNFINNLRSPFAIKFRNLSKLADIPVHVQTLVNPRGFVFPVVIVKRASCKPVGKWHIKDTWFINYAWSPCICPQCRAHLGWAFRNSDTNNTKDIFFALIEDVVLRESFADSLISIPKGFRNI